MLWIPNHTEEVSEDPLEPRINICTDATKAGDDVGFSRVAFPATHCKLRDLKLFS